MRETIKRPTRSSKANLLRRAGSTLQRALSLEGLEAETRTEGQLALAQVSLLLGENEIAQRQAIQAMEDARRYEQTWLLACAQRLMGSILTTMGQQEQADKYFEQALETFHSCGMRLEWARTLQSYGVVLLEQHSTGESSYEQGLKYLRNANQAFRECNAILDLQVIERILGRYTIPVPTPTRKSARQTR